MDSGNSTGSIQSSSGDDQDYDSRADSISAFLNNPTTQLSPFPGNPPPNPQFPPPPPQTHQTPNMFDLLSDSDYLDPTIQRSSSNSLLNLDMVWSRPIRSYPNIQTHLGGFTPSSSCSSSAQNQPFLPADQNRDPPPFPSTVQAQQPALVPEITSTSSRGGGYNTSNTHTNTRTNSTINDHQAHDNLNNNNNVARNPRKRTRASRRAPTTVLTTDTSNFRAMVQEFTGIPAPPLASLPFPRSRIDLFGSAAVSSMRSTHLDATAGPTLSSSSSYNILRPFAQKAQPQIPLVTSSIFPDSSTHTVASNPTNSNSTTTTNYQNLLNLQSPILNFQSLLQPLPKYPLPNSSLNLTSSRPPACNSLDILPGDHGQYLKMGVLEEYGLCRHGQVNAPPQVGLPLQNYVVSSSSDGALSLGGGEHVNNPQQVDWGNGSGGGNPLSSEQGQNGTLNCSAPSSNFRGDKGPPDNTTPTTTVGARSEGIVETWINSSSVGE